MPDDGDVFFDFEGDPLWSEGHGSGHGLEYLFGLVEPDDTDRGHFRCFWAHDRTEEKQALVDFFDYLRNRWAAHPGMHVYHYASYEVTALKRLTVQHQHGEDFLDELLRAGVFVDLYTVVKQSIRVSQPSYSIKKLEPLYMGEQLRDDEGVTTAADSIVQYAAYVEARAGGDGTEADRLLESIRDYNWYDCTSTWRLRDWLLAQLDARSESAGPGEATRIDPSSDTSSSAIDEVKALIDELMVHVPDADRTAEQQAVAMLAAAVGFHRREAKPHWWEHFSRLSDPVDEWVNPRGTLVAEDVTLLDDWAKVGSERTPGRDLRLVGRLEPGSSIGPGASLSGIYEQVPDGVDVTGGALRAVAGAVQVREVTADEDGRDVVLVREKLPKDVEPFAELPMAIFDSTYIAPGALETAIHDVAQRVAAILPGDLPGQPALDILAGRPPRLLDGIFDASTQGDADAEAIRSTVQRLDRSYVAVQRPPGTGKTYVGSRVVKALVQAGWRVGVVAQSHTTVEHFLDRAIEAGLPPDVVGKANKAGDKQDHPWCVLKKNDALPEFLAEVGGRLVGGTAWAFANADYVKDGQLDLLVIDEAGQFCLANTVAVSRSTTRLLLLGDPQHLPQVSQGTHPEPVDESALGWIAAGHEAMPPDRGFFLGRTWRMHSALTTAVSQLAYVGRLRSQTSCTDARELTGLEPGLHPVQVEHTGNDVQSAEEAEVVVAMVRDLQRSTWRESPKASARALRPKDVLVVAPYNAQVVLLRRRLDEAGLEGTRVGTVDKFQGREAPVVIVSMTASSPDVVPRGMDFLLNRNRLNVAISRGQWAALLVHSPALTNHLPSSIEGLEELGAFQRLRDTIQTTTAP